MVEVIQIIQNLHLLPFNQQRFTEVPLPCTFQVKKADITLHHVKGGYTERVQDMYYQAMMCALKKKQRCCCLSWGDTGALGFSGETSLEEDTAGAGVWDRKCWAEVLSCIHRFQGVGRLINGQVHPLRAVRRQRAWAPPGGVGGNGSSHLPSSFCVLAHGFLALGQRGQQVQTDKGEKGPPQSPHSGLLNRCGEELERLMGADSKEACSLRTQSCFLNMGGMGGKGRGRSMKGQSRRVSCVDSSMGV